jgi:hypothetical protein
MGVVQVEYQTWVAESQKKTDKKKGQGATPMERRHFLMTLDRGAGYARPFERPCQP